MPKYRKKPVVIDAFQLTWESVLAKSPKEKQIPDWIADDPAVKISLTDKIQNSEYLMITTSNGEMTANHLDWIIRDENGDLSTCKSGIFEKTYELVEE